MNKTLTICHFSDPHLGNHQYGSDNRYIDFFDALAETLAKILEIKPDVVLFCGDLFEVARPTPDMIKRAFGLFMGYFQRGGAPIIAIAGNHETTQTVEQYEATQITDLFDDIYAVSGGKYYTFNADCEVLYGKWDPNGKFIVQRNPKPSYDVAFVGLNRGYDVLKRVLRIKETHADIFRQEIPRFLLIHAVTKEVEEDLDAIAETDFSFADLEKLQFSYIALGHQHHHKHYDNQHIYLPGSLEDWNEDEWGWEKGFYKVEISWTEGDLSSLKTTGKFQPIEKCRPREKITWDLGSTTSQDVIPSLRSKMAEFRKRETQIDPEKIYHFEIKLKLLDGRPGQLNLTQFWDDFKENRAKKLFKRLIRIETSEVSSLGAKLDDSAILTHIFSQDGFKSYLGDTVEEKVKNFSDVKKEILHSIADKKTNIEKVKHSAAAFEGLVKPLIEQKLQKEGRS